MVPSTTRNMNCHLPCKDGTARFTTAFSNQVWIYISIFIILNTDYFHLCGSLRKWLANFYLRKTWGIIRIKHVYIIFHTFDQLRVSKIPLWIEYWHLCMESHFTKAYLLRACISLAASALFKFAVTHFYQILIVMSICNLSNLELFCVY